MDSEYHRIRPIIDAFDKMREILRNEEVDMPKIVVVGDQSSGKSSVLESITKLEFPRGQNTVTRCPMILQLKRPKSQGESAEVWIEGEDPSSAITITDHSQLSEAIMRKQDDLIKKEKLEISKTAINIKVFCKDVPELTLYDLPGITYKNTDVIKTIREIIEKYTLGSSTIILLVLPSNVDLTTSEALAIIKKQEDYKARTIAVITKIDLAEKGIYRKITGNELELKYNPIIVKNRNQEEIDSKENWAKIREKEYKLLASHDELKQLPEESKGTEMLIRLLMSLQKDILIDASYTMEEKFQKNLEKFCEERNKLPQAASSIYEKNSLFKQNLRKMIQELKMGMENNTTDSKESKFNITSRIRDKFDAFNTEFSKQKIGFFSPDFCEKVEFMIKESRGLLLQNFLDPKVFGKLIISEMKIAMEKYKHLTKTISDYMLNILTEFCKRFFLLHPNLISEMLKELTKINAAQKLEAENLIKEFISCETTIPFTSSRLYSQIFTTLSAEINNYAKDQSYAIKSTYIDSTIILKSPFVKQIRTEPKEQEQWCLNLQFACLSYWIIFESRFLDYLEMAILNKMVYFFQENLEDLIEKKFSPITNKFSDRAMEEDASITSRRKKLQGSIDAFSEALDILQKVQKP